MPGISAPTAEGISALLPYFNSLVGAVEAGGTTAQLWSAYRDAVSIAGGALGTPTIQDMNFVAGYARALVNSEGALAAGEPGNPIGSTMWAWAPWAAADTGSYLAERYQVRYAADLQSPAGELTTVWGVTDWEGSLEGVTKEQLLGRATTSAQEALDTGSPRVQAQLGFAEGFSFSEISRVQIMRL